MATTKWAGPWRLRDCCSQDRRWWRAVTYTSPPQLAGMTYQKTGPLVRREG